MKWVNQTSSEQNMPQQAHGHCILFWYMQCQFAQICEWYRCEIVIEPNYLAKGTGACKFWGKVYMGRNSFRNPWAQFAHPCPQITHYTHFFFLHTTQKGALWIPKRAIIPLHALISHHLPSSMCMFRHAQAGVRGNPLHMLWKHSTSWITGVISIACEEHFLRFGFSGVTRFRCLSCFSLSFKKKGGSGGGIRVIRTKQ